MKIILGAMMWSVILGVAVDVITANVAVDYFAVYHPKVIESRSPFLLALVWGVIASWWAGAIGGAALAFANWRMRVPANVVLRWVRNSCAVIWCVMLSIVGAIYLVAGFIPLRQRRPTFEYDRRLMAVALGHRFEYAFAAIAIVVVLMLMERHSKWSTPGR